MTLVLKYVFFALLATLTNIGTQYLAFSPCTRVNLAFMQQYALEHSQALW